MDRFGLQHRFHSNNAMTSLRARHAPRAPMRPGVRIQLAKRARVGAKVGSFDPALLRDEYLRIYNAAPGLWALGAVLFSLGQKLTRLIEVATTVEAVGGGSAQLKLELNRRVDDWTMLRQEFFEIVFNEVEDPKAAFDELYRRIFVRFPQDQGKWDYEDGGSQYPPKYGLAWEIGSLTNQVWAMWHPTLWISENPDEPWYSWIPAAIAGGWIEALNDVQSVISESPVEGPGWGAEMAETAEKTQIAAVDFAKKGADAIKKAAYGAGAAVVGLGLLFLGIFAVGGRR